MNAVQKRFREVSWTRIVAAIRTAFTEGMNNQEAMRDESKMCPKPINAWRQYIEREFNE